ncbi:MAG: efflux RND transporter periplasmic adaptor subunit [Mediterranea sp.]|jgi:membrane fusion protein (multidrug efflux system)|nr:efflux RND transporter periplasmic adaptor subunit [Mediterranea sp.]
MNKKIKWGIIILVGVAIVGGGIYSQLPKTNDELNAADKMAPGGQNARRQVLNVNAKIITPQSLTDGFTTTGVLLPDEEVDLSFETSGKIVEINFEEGTSVTKGQLLAKVNDRPLQAQLQRLTAQLKLAEDRVFRQDALLKRDAVSKEAYEQVKTDLATLNADIEIVKENIKLTELRAPFDGVIGLRQVSVGSYASPTTVVAKLTKIAPLKVEFSVPERYANQIRKGTNLSFRVEGRLNSFDAKVYAVESAIDPDMHQFTARALYPNTARTLLPGRYASVSLKKEEIPDAIAIPTQAIVPEMGKDKVFLYRSGKAEPVEITTGMRTDAEVQVVKGLQPGDTLITSGTLQLRMGLPVSLDNID